MSYDLARVPGILLLSVLPAVSYIYTKPLLRKVLRPSALTFHPLRSPSRPHPQDLLPKPFVPESIPFVLSTYRVFLTIPFLSIPDTLACFANIIV